MGQLLPSAIPLLPRSSLSAPSACRDVSPQAGLVPPPRAWRQGRVLPAPPLTVLVIKAAQDEVDADPSVDTWAGQKGFAPRQNANAPTHGSAAPDASSACSQLGHEDEAAEVAAAAPTFLFP